MLMKANGKAAEEVLLALNEVSAMMFEIVPEPAKPVPVPTVPPAPKPVDNGAMPKIDITEFDSPNCSERAATVRAVICHNTAGKFDPSVSWLCNPAAQASAHLVIGRDGKVACLVDFSKAAWHAGSREWNHSSIGIEIEAYDEARGMTPIQEQVLLRWIKYFMARYKVKSDMVKTHRSVLPGETDCPVLVWKTEADFAAWKAKNLAV